MQTTHANPDAVAQLWTQTPRFADLVKGVTAFQHPHYFWSQTDKLNALLQRIVTDSTSLGSDEDYQHAGEVLAQLLQESLYYGTLTRENLRALESNVRAFVDQVQAVDGLVLDWDERQRQKQIQLQVQMQMQAQAQLGAKATSKKRGRSDDWDDDVEVVAPLKRRRDTCGEEAMDMEAGYCGSFASRPPWMHSGVKVGFGINPNFYD